MSGFYTLAPDGYGEMRVWHFAEVDDPRPREVTDPVEAFSAGAALVGSA